MERERKKLNEKIYLKKYQQQHTIMINLKRKELSLFIHYRSCLTDAVRFFDIVSAEQIWDIKITYTFRVMCIETEPTGEKSRSEEMGVMERKKHFEHKSEQSIVKF